MLGVWQRVPYEMPLLFKFFSLKKKKGLAKVRLGKLDRLNCARTINNRGALRRDAF